MTAVPRCLATTDDRPDKPGPLPSRPPGGRHAGPAGHGAAPSPMPPCPCPARPSRISPEVEHRFRPKWNTDSGMWNIHSGGSGTPAPVRYVTVQDGLVALTNAERQARYRERRQAGESRLRYRRPADRRSRPQQWNDAVQTLLALQDQYRAWRDALPESLTGSATAALLDHVCDLDLSVLESVDLPRGFGRDG